MNMVMNDDSQTTVDPDVKTAVRRPSMYHVVMINDDFTPQDFVVKVLQEIFLQSHDEAVATMFEIHHYDVGVAGTYTKEIATEKAEQTMDIAQLNQFPLAVKVESAGDGNSN